MQVMKYGNFIEASLHEREAELPEISYMESVTKFVGTRRDRALKCDSIN